MKVKLAFVPSGSLSNQPVFMSVADHPSPKQENLRDSAGGVSAKRSKVQRPVPCSSFACMKPST